ncbi:L4 33 kDa protein [Human mastadenovirus C]|uniref:33K n=1 Tax=Human mastadenovirus C TaxID=129951 RepID=A0A3Q9HJU3_9ADEN|nr:33K [Human mastadenovirus C]QDQ71336.1 splicing factor [Human adenovirus sp.]WEG80621.1 protein 33K [Human adenovirus 108]AZR66546.1 33K [Human mastadenovirus C]AZR67010.1 33K [Human mastadenovirus C]
MAPKKKLQLPPPPPTDEEEYWDSQAEEVLDEEEEDMMEDWESLDEASEAEEVSDETPSPSVAFPSPAPQKLATVPSIATTSAPQAPPALPVRRPNRRWDTTGTRAAPTAPAAAAATSAATQKQRRPDSKTLTKPKKSTAAAAAGGGALRLAPNEPVSTRELRNRIFPTLYAIFQQSRGQEQELKIKNRSLRSLTRSCLYHKSEDQLRRTLEDAEALFSKYCALTLKD